MARGTRLIGYLKQFVAEVVGSLPLQQEGLRDVRNAEREARAEAHEPPREPDPTGEH
jgi:hypothetical protein